MPQWNTLQLTVQLQQRHYKTIITCLHTMAHLYMLYLLVLAWCINYNANSIYYSYAKCNTSCLYFAKGSAFVAVNNANRIYIR